MSRRIHKPEASDGLRHRSWAAATTSTGKEEEEEEKKKKYGLLHRLWAREEKEEEEERDLLHNPLWAREEEEEEEEEEERDLLHNPLWAREEEEEEEEEEERDRLHNPLWAREEKEEEEERDLLHPRAMTEEEIWDLIRRPWPGAKDELDQHHQIFASEEEEERDLLHPRAITEEEVWDLIHRPWPGEKEELDRYHQLFESEEKGERKGFTMRIAEFQEADSNSVSSSDSNNLEIVSETPPVEQEAEREKTSATPSPTGDQDSAITEELKQATKFTYFATATTEELKQATTFSYFATALAGGGILSLLIFHLGNKSGEPHTLFFKALTSFVLATFASGLSIILLTICAPPASYQIPIIRGLVSATLIFLALTGVGVSIVLLKAMGELAFVPAIVVVIVASIIAHCNRRS